MNDDMTLCSYRTSHVFVHGAGKMTKQEGLADENRLRSFRDEREAHFLVGERHLLQPLYMDKQQRG